MLMNSQDKIGEKLKYFRKRAKLSQFELEIMLETSMGSISRIESGEVNPNKETIIKISDILKLNMVEVASLFNLDINKDLARIAEITKKLSEEIELQKVLQTSVDILCHELNLLSLSIFLVRGDQLYSETLTNNLASSLLLRFIKVPFNKLHVSMKEHTDNLVVKSILEQKIYITNVIEEITRHAIPKFMANPLQRIVNFKTGIIIPLNNNKNESIGAMYLEKIL